MDRENRRDLPVNVLGQSPVAIQLPELLAASKPLALSSCTYDEGEASFVFHPCDYDLVLRAGCVFASGQKYENAFGD
ncbi:hypothetical protein PsorP6_012446 [Peronosclerospora sorghi]|uniref:Uncharacterized protein n=1 Tax=Peronosclerospora sorghi TaxID=230839 RepID=A0ACC0WIG6_9STRA|nr:hypothetical protein PsorP6_012446 [Peronosclerospora sorghi]